MTTDETVEKEKTAKQLPSGHDDFFHKLLPGIYAVYTDPVLCGTYYLSYVL